MKSSEKFLIFIIIISKKFVAAALIKVKKYFFIIKMSRKQILQRKIIQLIDKKKFLIKIKIIRNQKKFKLCFLYNN